MSIQTRLLRWIEDAEPIDPTPDNLRLLAEDDNGDILIPHPTRAGWWEDHWQWWRPSHWPPYIRSRRHGQYGAYVMVERES